MNIHYRLLLQVILDDYVLPVDGDHGVGHWARVLENGRRLSPLTGADLEIVSLFALLHDSRRMNEVTDPGHGRRAAQFARQIRGTAFDVDDERFELLYQACEQHTGGRHHPSVTVQTCWDADRLDLGRVGILPEKTRLCTDAARSDEIFKWADGRACFRVVPPFVVHEWGIDVQKSI